MGRIALVLMVVGLTACSIERALNRVDFTSPYTIDSALVEKHNAMFVADLHADSLLWNRDLSERGSYGHVDVPRALEGGVDFQVFSTVSKTPWGLNMEANDDTTDMLVANSMIQGWPARTWTSLLQRVLYQGQKLERLQAQVGEQLRLVRYAEDLSGVGESVEGTPIIGATLATEGGHVLEGKLENVQVLFDAGFRSMGLVHFFDNELGGSAHGMQKGGLTPFGTQVVAEMERLGLIVDLAHASKQLIEDVVRVAKKPLLVSHTGVVGTCPGPRNLSDAQLKAIAATDGLIGLALFSPAICERSYVEAARTLKYTVDLIGVRHVALGTDHDGAVPVAYDVSGLPLLTGELLKRGMSEADVAAVMGGNVRRFFAENLPRRR